MTERRLPAAQAAAVLGGVVVLAGSWGVAAAGGDQVPAWEARMFEVVNGMPDALWPLLWAPMQAGSFAASIVVSGVTVAVSRNVRLGLAAFVASQAAYWGAKGVKEIVERGRPAALLDDVHLREQASGWGYLSGHTAVAFALAAALGASLPRRWRAAALAGAAAVALARVYAGAHLPLDVVGGAGLGLALGILARWAFRPGATPSGA